MNAIHVLLTIAGVGYILFRRMTGGVVQVKSLLVLPAVLTAIGAFQLSKLDTVDVSTVVFVAVGVLLSVAVGAVRGTTVYLGRRGDELWMRYRVSTVALWLLNFAVKAAIVPVEVGLTGHSASDATHGLLLSIGLGILAESGVVLFRAMQRDGVVWENGSHGRAHTRSLAFDDARDHVRSTGVLRGAVSTVKRDW